MVGMISAFKFQKAHPGRSDLYATDLYATAKMKKERERETEREKEVGVCICLGIIDPDFHRKSDCITSGIHLSSDTAIYIEASLTETGSSRGI